MITELKLKWVKKINPDYKATLFEGEIIKYPVLWSFDGLQWTEKNAKITRKCGMIPVEVDNLLFLGWGYAHKDFTTNLILAQYKLTDFIDETFAYYLRHQSPEFIENIIGKRARRELIQCAYRFHEKVMEE